MSRKPAATPGPRTVKVPKPAPQPGTRQTLRFRTDNLKSSYCNMCNATSTREEVVLNFGLNQNWDQPTAQPDVLEVDLQHRVVLSPFAAKRLSEALGKLVGDYEARYGKLS
jgi:hypothetical protein